MSNKKHLISKLSLVLWLGWVGVSPVLASERWGGPTSLVDRVIEAVGSVWASWQFQSADPANPTDPADPTDPTDPADPTDPTDPTDPVPDPGTGGDATIGPYIDPRG